MGEYDIALKAVLRGGDRVFAELNSGVIAHWHNVELPEVRSLRVDMLGETSGGGLVHIELQSQNDVTMTLRMLEYCAAIYRQFGRFPEQIVLYVENPQLRMSSALAGSGISFACRMVDIQGTRWRTTAGKCAAGGQCDCAARAAARSARRDSENTEADCAM